MQGVIDESPVRQFQPLDTDESSQNSPLVRRFRGQLHGGSGGRGGNSGVHGKNHGDAIPEEEELLSLPGGDIDRDVKISDVIMDGDRGEGQDRDEAREGWHRDLGLNDQRRHQFDQRGHRIDHNFYRDRSRQSGQSGASSSNGWISGPETGTVEEQPPQERSNEHLNIISTTRTPSTPPTHEIIEKEKDHFLHRPCVTAVLFILTFVLGIIAAPLILLLYRGTTPHQPRRTIPRIGVSINPGALGGTKSGKNGIIGETLRPSVSVTYMTEAVSFLETGENEMDGISDAISPRRRTSSTPENNAIIKDDKPGITAAQTASPTTSDVDGNTIDLTFDTDENLDDADENPDDRNTLEEALLEQHTGALDALKGMVGMGEKPDQYGPFQNGEHVMFRAKPEKVGIKTFQNTDYVIFKMKPIT